MKQTNKNKFESDLTLDLTQNLTDMRIWTKQLSLWTLNKRSRPSEQQQRCGHDDDVMIELET